MRTWIKKNLSTLVLILVFLIGLSLLLYPAFSDYWNSFHQSRAIASYSEQVSDIDDKQYDEIIQKAKEYNETIPLRANRWVLTEEEKAVYSNMLDVGGTGIMGYVEIPKVAVSLPIYHGVDEAVLQIAVGHIEGTSLPVGGTGTHCAISGHRGLPSAKLFTNIDELKEGDTFLLYILDEVLTYEVDQIRIVEPNDVSSLEFEEDKDLCTLVTCTPYGVNSHRLLVRGHRIETLAEHSIRVTADAMQIDEMLVASFVAVPILISLLIGVLSVPRRRKK